MSISTLTERAQQNQSVMTLYELTQEWAEIQDALIDSGGELTPEIEARLDALPGALQVKADGYCYVIQQLLRSADAAKAEADRLSELARVRKNAADRLKDRLKSAMETTGQLKLESDRFKVRVQKNGRPSIAWTGEPDALPCEYSRVAVSLDGQAAYEAWKAGRELPEGFKVTEGTHLRIS